jgi:hypothetical protein
MASLSEILNDPNYLNANEETKAAIFTKYAPQDENYTQANAATQAAIRSRFGVEGQPGIGARSNLDTSLYSGYQGVKGGLAGLAGRLGIMDIEKAKQIQEEAEEKGKKAFKPIEGGWGTDFSGKFVETLGQSIPYMIAPIAAAGVATVAGAPGAVATGISGLASAIQFAGSNLQRQQEQGIALEDTNLTGAIATAIPQAALETLSFRMIPGVQRLFGKAGKEITEAQAAEIAKQGIIRSTAAYGAQGARTGGIEGMTEVGQQFLERLQAGLSLGDQDAVNEFVASFVGGAVLGGPLSIPGTAMRRDQARQMAAQAPQAPETPAGETETAEAPPAVPPVTPPVAPASQEGVPSDVGIDRAAMEEEFLRSQGQLPLAPPVAPVEAAPVAPVAQPAQIAQAEDVQPSAEDIVPLDDKGEPIKAPESIAPPKAPEVIDPNIEAQLAAEEPDVESTIPDYPPPPKAEKVSRAAIEARPARVMYGVDVDGNLNVPVTEGGLPFKTRKEAIEAKKLQPDLRIMEAKDGFVLAEKTAKEIAADKIKAKRLQQPPAKIMAAHEFIASLGGLNKKEASELDPDAAKKNIRVGNKFFYSPKGMTIAEAAEKLREAGYIESENSNEAYQILQDSIADPVYSIYDADAIAEQRFAERDAELAAQAKTKEAAAAQEAIDISRENAEFQDYLVLERELGDPTATMLDLGYTQKELQDSGFVDANFDLQVAISALHDLATSENIDALGAIDSVKPKKSQTTQEKVNAEEQAIATEITQAAQPRGRADVGKADETQGAETKEPVKTSALIAAKPPADTTEVLVSRPPKDATVAQPPINPKPWESLPDMTAKDTWIIRLFDKNRNLKLTQEAIAKAGGELKQELDAYTAETLSHGKIERNWSDFLVFELDPVLKEMQAKKVSDDQLTEYLVMRHAKEANKLIAERNPDNPAKQDNGVGVTYKEREEYFENLSPERKKVFESIAKKVDGILTKTRDMLEKGGVISPEDRKTWEEMFEFYIPTRREESDFMLPSSSYRRVGDFAKSRTGSSKKVVDVLANIAINREIAINRIEKERIYRSVYGLSVMNPNPEYWKAIVPEAYKNRDELANELVDMFDIDRTDANDMADLIFNEPSREYFDKQAGVVRNRIDSSAKYKDYVLPVKMEGKDRFVFFNPKNARAAQTIQSLRGLDVPQLRGLMAAVAPLTRFFSAINTQYNLIFGAFNFVRDVQGAQFNLSTTPIADRKIAVLKGTFKAIPEIYTAIRERNAGKPFSDTSDGSWDDFTKHGGKVGYKDQFAKVNESVNVIEKKLKEIDRGGLKQFAFDVKDWVSNANDVLENAVRVSTYREALDKFKSEYKGEIPARELENMKEKAANIAKNITVNFNRKGTAGVTAGALYAFFNASAQGTAKLYETLKGPLGKKIVAGGIALGIAQAVWLAMAGFDEDEPTEFIKQKNLIFPTGDGKYVMWPMPFGFNVFPNIGRLLTETVTKAARGQNVSDKLFDTITMLANAFNPLGGGGLAQMITPTVGDPLMALVENRDAFGRPISRESRGTEPKPGYTISRDPSPSISQYLAEFINNVSFGDKDKRGWVSPTADQIDYLAGQIGGGVYRELSKIGKAGKSVVTGEEMQDSQIPVYGKIAGDINSKQAISQRFYSNVKTMSEHEDAIKGRISRKENVSQYMRENPEASLWRRANTLENEISKLNARRRELVKKSAPIEEIKRIDDQKTRRMKEFNDRVRKYNQ